MQYDWPITFLVQLIKPTSDLKIYEEIESMWYTSVDQAFGYCHTFDMNLNPKYKFFSLQEDLSTALIFTNREKKTVFQSIGTWSSWYAWYKSILLHAWSIDIKK